MIKDFLLKRKKDIFFVFLLLILSLFCLRQFFPKGIFYAHDVVHHVTRLGNFIEELKLGQFPVRLGTKMANGYSYPVFNYTYPLPYYLASLCYFFGFDLVSSIKIVFFLASILSVFVFYCLLRLDNKADVSFLGAILYLFLPFRFLSIFVAAQIGIVLAFLFAPLSLYFLRLLMMKDSKKIIVFLSLSLSALILSHLISVIILLPVFIVYFWLYLPTGKNRKDIVKKTIIAIFLSFLLSAFYFLPAVFESRYIKAGHQETVAFADNFISLKQLLYSKWGYGFSNLGFDDQLSFQLGFAQLAVLFLSIIASFKIKKAKKIIAYYLLSFLIIFLMLPQSNLLWQNFSFLQKVQHPWRFLLALAVLMPLILGELFKHITNLYLKYFLFIFIFLLAIYSTRNYQRPMESSVRYDDQYYQSNTQQFYGSGDIAWEFLPKWVPDQPKTFPDRVIDQTLLVLTPEKPAKLALDQTWDLTLAEKQEVSLNVFYFPSWQLELDGQKQSNWPNEQGLITTEIPAGNHQLRLYLASTNLEKISNGLSLLAIIISFVILVI